MRDTGRLGIYLCVPKMKRWIIERQFSSSLRQLVEKYVVYFMDYDPLASWRRVIVCLEAIEEKEAADKIRHLAEAVRGEGR